MKEESMRYKVSFTGKERRRENESERDRESKSQMSKESVAERERKTLSKQKNVQSAPRIEPRLSVSLGQHSTPTPTPLPNLR